jgi:hypothetical protein
MKEARIVGGILALSGTIFFAFAWMLPPLWPGYLIWVGWIVIAVTPSGLDKRWFWLASAFWNAGVLWLFFGGPDWSHKEEPFFLWHARIHSAVAVLASVYLCFLKPRKRPNQSPAPMPLTRHGSP